MKQLLKPHRCYLNDIKNLINLYGYENIKGMCHITGGGLYNNFAFEYFEKNSNDKLGIYIKSEYSNKNENLAKIKKMVKYLLSLQLLHIEDYIILQDMVLLKQL